MGFSGDSLEISVVFKSIERRMSRGLFLSAAAIVTAWSLLISQSQPAGARPIDGAPLDRIEQRLQLALEDLVDLGALGTAAGLALPTGQRIVIAAGYADRGRTEPLTPGHGFQIASNTKMFTAAAILLLEKDGKLDLQDKVSDYVPGYIGGKRVRIRHLLTHTSGIADGIVFLDFGQPYPTERFSLEDILTLSKLKGQQFEPGERFEYNDTGFDILGRIIELASGQSRARFLRERILGPLRMTNTYVGEYETWPEGFMARGYYTNPGSSTLIETSYPKDLAWAGAAGDMTSTVDDLLAWTRVLVKADNPTGLTLDDFRREIVEQRGPLMTGYGYGIYRFSNLGQEAWGHGGVIHGYLSFVHADPVSGVSFVILTSLDGRPGRTTRDIHAAMKSIIALAFQLSHDAPAD